MQLHHAIAERGRCLNWSRALARFLGVAVAVALFYAEGTFAQTSLTGERPDIFIDTDAKNEVDDQNMIAYCLFSDLPIVGVSASHWKDRKGTEEESYDELVKVVDLCRRSGSPKDPPIYHGADRALSKPESGNTWDTVPIETPASRAMMKRIEHASKDDPIWLAATGPATNMASAVLLAAKKGMTQEQLRQRVKLFWIGGEGTDEFNWSGDVWAGVILGRFGLDHVRWPAYETRKIKADLSRYPENEVGNYLRGITPDGKALYDIAAPAAFINRHAEKGWESNLRHFVVVSSPDYDLAWREEGPNTMVRNVDEDAMANDFYETLHRNPARIKTTPITSER